METTVADVDAPTPEDITRRAVHGVGWTAGGQLVRQVVQLAISIVTARLLLPSDFGQVAQVVVITGLANQISDAGLGPALVQRAALEERHRSSVFWLQLSLGVLVTSAALLGAPFVAAFYGQPSLRRIALALAPAFLFSSMCTSQRALLTRAMRFRATATIDLASLTLSGGVCVTAAVLGAGVYSIVLQVVTLNVVTFSLLWTVGGWRPKRIFDRTAIAELLPFSGNLFGFNLLNYTVRNGDNVLIGRILGSTALGLYARGYSILLYPTRQISSVLGNVMFSSLSKLSHDRQRLKRGYLRAIGVIALVTFPLMSGLALVADDFVPGVLGRHWVAAVPIIRIFAILGIGESIFTTIGWIYQSTGRTDVLLRVGLLMGTVPLAGIVVGSLFGDVQAVAIGYAVSTIALLYPCVRIAGGLIGMTFADMLRSVRSVALCAGGMVIAVTITRVWLPESMSDLGSLAVEVAVGALTYALLVHVLRVEPYLDLREQVRTHLRPRGSAA